MSDAGQAYSARLAGYVKDKDPIAMQRETPQRLAQLIEGVPAEKLTQAPAPGKWSAAEILAHLAEAEVASSWRYRQMLENSGTTLTAFNQDVWEKLGDYRSWDAREALAQFRALREANLRMFSRLTDEQWESFGMHVERGRLTVRELASQIAGHDASHVQQMERTLGQKGQS